MKLQLFVSAYTIVVNTSHIHMHTWRALNKTNLPHLDIYICYSSAGRSVLGKTMYEVLSTQDRGHSFSQYGPTTKVRIYLAIHKGVTVARGQK